MTSPRTSKKAPARLTVMDPSGSPLTALPPAEPVDAVYEEVEPNTYAAIIAGLARDMSRLAMGVLGHP